MPRVASAKHVLASTANIRNICVVVLITVMLTTAIDRDICVCVCAESHIRQGLAWLFSCQDKHSNTATQIRTQRERESERHTRIRPDTAQSKHIIHINVSTCVRSRPAIVSISIGAPTCRSNLLLGCALDAPRCSLYKSLLPENMKL